MQAAKAEKVGPARMDAVAPVKMIVPYKKRKCLLMQYNSQREINSTINISYLFVFVHRREDFMCGQEATKATNLECEVN